MNSDRLNLLCYIHNEFVSAAALPEGSRPYSAQNRLEEVQKLIMEEIKKEPKAKTDPNDDIPF